MSRSLGTTFLMAAAAAAGLQCAPGKSSGPTLTITANPSTVFIVTSMGMTSSYTTLTIGGTDQGAPFADGTTGFDISTNYGSLGSPNAGAGSDTQDDTGETISGMVITVKLYADPTLPPNGMPATVTVKYTDAYSLTATAQTTVTFKPGNLAPTCTPTNMEQGCVAKVERLSFSCDSYNLGILTGDLGTSSEEPCNSTATDSLDQPVDGTQINYLSEAGTVMINPTAGNLAYFPEDPNALHTMPVDTDPHDLDNYMGQTGMSAETTCCSWTANGVTHNSRDGLVTIIAWVYADPVAIMNAPIAMYEGEPFVDANDNQQYDMGEDFVDLNNNGTWDAMQDTGAQMALWRQIKVLWTGSEDPVPPIRPVVATGTTSSTATIPYGQTQNFTFALVDSNCNVLSCNDRTQDGVVNWNVGSQGSSDLEVPTTLTPCYDSVDPNHMGMLMDGNFNFKDPFLAANWLIGAYVEVPATNNYMCNSTNTAEQFTLQGQISHNLDLNSSGTPSDDTMESTATLTGTLDPIPASTCL